MDDIEAFQGGAGVTRMAAACVAVQKSSWSSMTSIRPWGSFEQGLKEDHPAITPSMIYAYAALMSGAALAMAPPTSRSISQPCSTWPRKKVSRSAARTSKPARRL